MAIIDVVKWDGTPNVFAYKHPENNLTTFTQLIVNESQEAVLFHKGKLLQKFGSGKHTLTTENIPVLENLFGIPFGGKNPFTAEVWFVNKTIPLDIKWGTLSPLQLRDPEYKVMIPVRAYGQFGIQIEDTEKFLVKLVGTLPYFDKEKIVEYFKGFFLTKASSIIAKKLTGDKISVLDVSAHLYDISNALKEDMKAGFAEFGIKLISFYVNSINVSEEDESVKRLKSLLSKKAEMDMLGYNYQQERSFNVMENAAKNEGMAGTVAGAGMGLGMGFGLGGSMRDMSRGMNEHLQPAQPIEAVNCPKCNTTLLPDAVFCAKCGGKVQRDKDVKIVVVTCDKCKKEMPSHSKFCPHCGDLYNPCSECGSDNPKEVTNCRNCGAAMPVNCPKCNERVPANAKFCAGCGTPVSKACPKCGKTYSSNYKFCPDCGEKIAD